MSRSLLLLIALGCSGGPTEEPNQDADGDGFRTPLDCDDADADVNPGRRDVWNDGVDSDCDGEDGAILNRTAFDLQLVEISTGGFFGAAVAICDLDGDGQDDLVVGRPTASGGGEVYAYFGPIIGTGEYLDSPDVTFEGPTTLYAGFEVGCGDVDGDGDEDVVAYASDSTQAQNQLLTFVNPGSFPSTVSTSSRIRVGSGEDGVSDLAVADLDGDGDAEIVACIYDDGTGLSRGVHIVDGGTVLDDVDLEAVSVRLSSLVTRCGTLEILGDLSGDGNPELGVLELGSSRYSVFANPVPLGSSDYDEALWGSVSVGPLSGLSSPASTGDFNGDGSLDLAVKTGSTPAGEVLLVVPDAGGLLPTDVLATAPGLGTSDHEGDSPIVRTIGDIDGDGNDDIALMVDRPNGSHDLLLVDGAAATTHDAGIGTIKQFHIRQDETTLYSKAVTGDLDGDGTQDLIYSLTDFDSIGRVQIIFTGNF